MAKKVKVIDIHEQYKKLNKASKIVLSIGTVIGIFSAVVIIAVSVLSLCGVFPMPGDKPRTYACLFKSYDGDDLFYHVYTRGEKLDVDIDKEILKREDDPDGTTHTFLGWDINGDSLPDILPSKMYYSFVANPVYFDFNPYGDVDSTEPETPKEAIRYASK